jgi:hypothetical protein
MIIPVRVPPPQRVLSILPSLKGTAILCLFRKKKKGVGERGSAEQEKIMKRFCPLGFLIAAILWCGCASSGLSASADPLRFGLPSPDFPYYHLTHTFEKEKFGPFRITEVQINGEEVRDFQITDDGESAWDNKVTGETTLVVTARCDWVQDQEYTLEVTGVDDQGIHTILTARGRVDGGLGYWNRDWKYYATVVLDETAGLRREQEPIHIKMALYADRMTDPKREIRVVEVKEDGGYGEVPCQVYHTATWNQEDRIRKEELDPDTGIRIVRYLPTTTLEVAFFADVGVYEKKVYLVFYGNPEAPAPSFPTDLSVSGPHIGQSIENDLYRFDLDESSGAFFTLFLKQGKGVVLEHKLETNGAIHWNPGVYSPPHAWVHASDWESPGFEQVSGPIFHMTKRYASLPHMDQVWVMITYVFYAGKPYVITTSLTEVMEELYVKTIRNGEIVFNHEELNEFVYASSGGGVKGFMIKGSRPHPGHAVRVPYDVPWLAFINREKGIGFCGITLDVTNTNRYGGLSDAEQPYFYVANGPWIYWSRALNYAFGSNNPSRMIRAKKGSIYYEKTAYMPFVFKGTDSDAFQGVEDLAARLKHPLRVRYHLDTDLRNNKNWVVPILVEPFDEGVEGAVGGEH